VPHTAGTLTTRPQLYRDCLKLPFTMSNKDTIQYKKKIKHKIYSLFLSWLKGFYTTQNYGPLHYNFEVRFYKFWLQAGIVGGSIVWIPNEVTDIPTSLLLRLLPGSFLYFRSFFGYTSFEDTLLIISVENDTNGAINFEHLLTTDFPRNIRGGNILGACKKRIASYPCPKILLHKS
jgi:hypothetical protein